MTLVGIDVGTTTICGLALDPDSGSIQDVVREPNASGLPAAAPEESLQDPEAILAVCERILARLLRGGQVPAGIGVTGQMHGILYVDRGGRALSPLYTWQDGRGEREYAGGRTYAQHAAEIVGAPLATGMGVVTHFWNLRNDCVPAGAAGFCTIADFVAMRLAGATEPLLDPSNAASLGCFDLEALCFRVEAAEGLGMDPALFPRVALDYPALGSGPGGAPVFVALGDNQASLLGAVRELARSAHVNVGTGSQISVYTKRCVQETGIDVRPFPFGGYILVGAGLCGGRAYSFLHDFFHRSLRLFSAGAAGAAGAAETVGGGIWEAMNAVGPHSLPSPRRLVVDTRFQGTRADPSIRGSIANLAPDSFTPEHLIVGIRDGMAAELFGCYERFGGATRGVDTLVGSGNGIRLNPELRRTFELKFGMPMRVPEHREEAACGAALLAGVASGLLADLDAAGELIRYDENRDTGEGYSPGGKTGGPR